MELSVTALDREYANVADLQKDEQTYANMADWQQVRGNRDYYFNYLVTYLWEVHLFQ